MKINQDKIDALNYHKLPRPGKIGISITKPCSTERDLSLAYTPHVAEVCLEIKKDISKSYDYTARSNLVAVITNGTAVLGLGDIGPFAAKPVMEGKAVLFKRFADIDAFDLEIDEKDTEKFIQIVKAVAPTFGGINLEDIRAPECFIIEQRLKEELSIPVFHDDQHGTAIVVAAALQNALELVAKRIDKIRCVFSGAGAAAVAVARMLTGLGVKKENLWMFDSRGIILPERAKSLKFSGQFANGSDGLTIKEALRDADVFIGLSVGNIIDDTMIKNMAPKPIVFAMANPIPEIAPDIVKVARPDAIIATGRSDYPNQINNVLAFPGVFRGVLDLKAKAITEEMKIAAVRALSMLAREDVPAKVCKAYGLDSLGFGPDYILPKPFDTRVVPHIADAIKSISSK